MDPKKNYRELYKKLPSKIRWVLAYENFDQFVIKIVTKYNFEAVVLQKIVKLVADTIVGLNSKGELPLKIREIAELNERDSLDISNELSARIIDNIHNLYDEIVDLSDEKYEDNLGILEELRKQKDVLKPEVIFDVLIGNNSNNQLLDLVYEFKNLPEKLQNLILAKEWVRRVKEIGIKYSLNDSQIDTLIYEIILIMIRLEEHNNLLKNIKKEIGISELMTEQLTEEIEERIFTWISKQYTEKELGKNENTLDTPPANLPGVEIGNAGDMTLTANKITASVDEEEIKKVAPILEDKKDIGEINDRLIEEKEDKTESEPVVKTPEPVLLRDEVKDFFAPSTPIIDTVHTEPKIVDSEKNTFVPPTNNPSTGNTSFIANKLTQPTKTPNESRPTEEVSKKYTVDPYREPLD